MPRRMSTAQQQHGGAAPDALLSGQAGDGGAPANGDRDSVDDVIERLLSVRGEWESEKSDEAFGALYWRMGVD